MYIFMNQSRKFFPVLTKDIRQPFSEVYLDMGDQDASSLCSVQWVESCLAFVELGLRDDLVLDVFLGVVPVFRLRLF